MCVNEVDANLLGELPCHMEKAIGKPYIEEEGFVERFDELESREEKYVSMEARCLLIELGSTLTRTEHAPRCTVQRNIYRTVITTGKRLQKEDK